MSLTVGNASRNNIAFGTKVPTEDVLQVVTERLLKEDGMDSFYRVCDIMTGESNFTKELPEVAKQCTTVLVERFPVLNTIIENSKKFFDGSSKSLEQITAWTNKQVKLFGSKEADVPEFAPNKFKIDMATKSLFSGKKVINVIVDEK